MKEEFIKSPYMDKQFPFRVLLSGKTYPDSAYHILRKNSTMMCVEYIITGKGTVKNDGKEYSVEKGDCYLLAPGKRHEYYSDKKEPFEKIWFNAEGTLINVLVDLYGLSEYTVFKNSDADKYILEIQKQLSRNDCSSLEIQEKCTIIFHKLLNHLKRNICDKTFDSAEIIKNYIDLNFFKDISIEELSNIIYKSESQTIKIFKEKYCITPYQYLIKCKINYAKNLLLSTNLQIKDIAYKLNFADEHYFSSLFKEKVGVSPGKYRTD